MMFGREVCEFRGNGVRARRGTDATEHVNTVTLHVCGFCEVRGKARIKCQLVLYNVDMGTGRWLLLMVMHYRHHSRLRDSYIFTEIFRDWSELTSDTFRNGCRLLNETKNAALTNLTSFGSACMCVCVRARGFGVQI